MREIFIVVLLADIAKDSNFKSHIAQFVLLRVENDDRRADVGNVVAELVARLQRLISRKAHCVRADLHDALALVETDAAMGLRLGDET